MNRRCSTMLLATTMCFTFSQAGFTQEWTRFRGPNGAGQSEATTVPVKWSKDDYNWEVELPGKGHSSPVLWGKKIFLLSADPHDATRHVLCLNADSGKILWDRSFPSATLPLHRRNSYATSTPTVDAKRVYVTWSTLDKMTFMALDHEGEIVWEKNLGPYVNRHGYATSPIVYRDKVFLALHQEPKPREAKQPGDSFIFALNSSDGTVLWKTPREMSMAAHSTPCIYHPPEGPAQLIVTSRSHGVSGLNLDSGHAVWSIDVFRKRVVSSPIIVSGLIMGTTGTGGGNVSLAAVRPGENPQLVFRVEKQASYVPTPVARNNLLFIISDRGIASCIDASDGTVHWRKRIGGRYSASPIRVGNRIYCVDDDGVVVVLSAEKEYKLLAKNRLDRPTRSTPAVAGGRLYLRTYSHLISLGG